MKKIRIAYLAVSQSAYRIPLYDLFAKADDFEFKVFFDMEKTIGNPDWKVQKNANFNYEICKSISLWFPTRWHGKWERAYFVFSSFNLINKLFDYRPDVIITVEHSIRTLYSLLAKLITGCKVIVKFDGTIYTEKRVSMPKLLFRKIISKYIDAYCVLSDSGKEYLNKVLDVNTNKIFKTPFVCDIKKFGNISQAECEELRKRYQLEGKLVFISIGQLIPKKNVEGLINAWCDMPSAFHENTILLIVGDGPEKRIVKDKMDQFENIKLLGRIKYEDMPAIMCMADVFVHPSFEDQWALVVNEAMASGLPIMVSKYAGASELVSYGENGFIFDPHDRKEVEEKLAWCFFNRDKLKKMGMKSKEIIRDYTYENTLQIFRNAIMFVGNS